MAQARIAWEYSAVFPGLPGEPLARDSEALYSADAIGGSLEFDGVGVGVAAANSGKEDTARPAAETKGPWPDGKLISGAHLFTGEWTPRILAEPCVDPFLAYFNQGSGYPGLLSGLAMPEIPLDAPTGGHAALAYAESLDLLVCHASLQWYPNHDELIPNLLAMLKEGGVFAASIPQFGEGMELRRPRFWVEGHPGCTTTQIQFRDAGPRLRNAASRTYTYQSADEYDRLFRTLKWLRAGNPAPVAGGIALEYPFLLITAVCR